MREWQKVTLPLPPSGNHAYMPVRIGRSLRLILTPEMRAYKKEAWAIVLNSRLKKVDGSIRLDIFVYRKSRNADVDSGIKQVIDSVLNQDKAVSEYHVYRRFDPKSPRIEVYISATNVVGL